VAVHITADLAEWDRATLAFLARDPVANTLPLGIGAALRAGASFGDLPPWFAWVVDGDAVVGAAVRTPPYLLAVTDLPLPAATALGATIADVDMPGLLARADVAAAVARAAGRGYQVRMAEVQYRLDRLIPPTPLPGTARPATEDDDALIVRWTREFEIEAGVYVRGADASEAVRRRCARGDALWVWWVDDVPVSMAGRVAAVNGVPRVGPVYTPPEHRGRGYGAAITAAVCSDAFAGGATACTLFADAANPTSNGVYTRLGFYPLREVVEAVFDHEAGG
jgi:GNAT superfamily N-acetyltransferase